MSGVAWGIQRGIGLEDLWAEDSIQKLVSNSIGGVSKWQIQKLESGIVECG